MSVFKNQFKVALDAAAMEMDATDTMFVQNELEKVETEVYKTEFPELQYRELIPLDVSNDPAAETISYKQATQIGKAKIIFNYADDLPNIARYMKKYTRDIYSIGNMYEYAWDDIEKAARNGMSLSSDLGVDSREAHERETDDIMLLGHSEAGIEGLFDLSGVLSPTIAADGTGSVKTWFNTTTLAALKTPAQIIRDVNLVLRAPYITSKQIEKPDTFLLPISHYDYIATTPRSDTSDTTILQFLQNNHPGVTFMAATKLAGILGSGNGERLIAYRRDRRKLRGNITYPFTQMPIQRFNLMFKVPCVSKVGGLVVPRPYSIAYGDGV